MKFQPLNIVKSAQQIGDIKEYREENALTFNCLKALKVIASGFSIATSLVFLKTALCPFIGESAAWLLAAILLVVIELVVNKTLFQTATYAFRGRWSKFSHIVPFSLAVFVLSSWLSVSGIKTMSTDKSNNIESITIAYDREVQQLGLRFENDKKDIEQSIKRIESSKVFNWGSRKEVLSKSQLADIRELNTQKISLSDQLRKDKTSLKTQFDTDIQADETKTAATASGYGVIIMGLMLLQLFSAIALAFMSKHIIKSEDKEGFCKQDVLSFQSALIDKTTTQILGHTQDLTNTVLAELETSFNYQQGNSKKRLKQNNSIEGGQQVAPPPEQPKKKSIGFPIPTTNEAPKDYKSEYEALLAYHVNKDANNAENAKHDRFSINNQANDLSALNHAKNGNTGQSGVTSVNAHQRKAPSRLIDKSDIEQYSQSFNPEMNIPESDGTASFFSDEVVPDKKPKTKRTWGTTVCKNPKCQKTITKMSHNQVYCSNSNCRLEHNEQLKGYDLSKYKK